MSFSLLFLQLLYVYRSILDIAIQYQEKLIGKKVHFIPKIEKIEKLTGFFSHKQLNVNGSKVFNENNKPLTLGSENDFVLINNEKSSLKFS